MLRVARDAAGSLLIGKPGGRGAWLCLDGDDAHDAAIAPSLARGLRGGVKKKDLEEVATAVRRRRAQERGGHD